MEYEKFQTLCKYLGDQSLDEKDRWKSLKYLNIAGQAAPGFDFQRLLKEGRINFITNTDIGPGFTIIDIPFSDMGVTNSSEPILTFIPLQSVDSFTFVVTKESETGGNISIEELTSDITGNTNYEIPVIVKFTNSLYYFKKGEEIKFPVMFSKELTSDNYDVTYKDSLGNTLSEKPTNIGEYFVIITCKNGYTGKGMSKFEITN